MTRKKASHHAVVNAAAVLIHQFATKKTVSPKFETDVKTYKKAHKYKMLVGFILATRPFTTTFEIFSKWSCLL